MSLLVFWCCCRCLCSSSSRLVISLSPEAATKVKWQLCSLLCYYKSIEASPFYAFFLLLLFVALLANAQPLSVFFSTLAPPSPLHRSMLYIASPQSQCATPLETLQINICARHHKPFKWSSQPHPHHQRRTHSVAVWLLFCVVCFFGGYRLHLSSYRDPFYFFVRVDVPRNGRIVCAATRDSLALIWQSQLRIPLSVAHVPLAHSAPGIRLKRFVPIAFSPFPTNFPFLPVFLFALFSALMFACSPFQFT